MVPFDFSPHLQPFISDDVPPLVIHQLFSGNVDSTSALKVFDGVKAADVSKVRSSFFIKILSSRAFSDASFFHHPYCAIIGATH